MWKELTPLVVPRHSHGIALQNFRNSKVNVFTLTTIDTNYN
jgi:hypothetical protein